MHKQTEFLQKRMKIFASVLLLLAFVPFSGYAQGVPVKTVPLDSICMEPVDAIKVVAAFESEADLKARIPLLEKITDEYRSQRDLSNESAAAQERKAESANKALDIANKALEASKQLAKIDDENCKKKIEAATPSFFHQLGTHIVALVLGGGVVWLLLVL